MPDAPTAHDTLTSSVTSLVYLLAQHPEWQDKLRGEMHGLGLPAGAPLPYELYVGRWLRAPIERPDGALLERTKGTPQGGVVSQLLPNLFLHYAFDAWMQRTFPSNPFERIADDCIVHCRSEKQARLVLEAIRARLAECGLELHSTKTKIVYCKDDDLGNSKTSSSIT